MLSAFGIGVSTLNVGQRALELVGQNIANATTPGYHRQGISTASKVIGDQRGAGVEVKRLFRYSTPSVRSNIIATASEQAKNVNQLETNRQVESLFAGGDSSIDGRLQSFFNSLELLSTTPTSFTQKRVTVDTASALANQFNQLTQDISQVRNQQYTAAVQTAEEINRLSPQIANLNIRIAQVEATGDSANDLRDQRDTAINDLAKLVDIRLSPQENGVVNVIAANTGLIVGEIASPVEVFLDPSGQMQLREQTSGVVLKPTSGTIAGQFEEYNTNLPAYLQRVDELANKLIETVNSVQSTGISARGPMTTVRGTASVANPTALLNTQDLPSPIVAGTLNISVTNQGTGNRTLVPVAIDPATQSLQDVANAITTATGGNVQGLIDPATNTLRMQAQAGFAFDFAGRVPSTPNAVAMNGTSVPSVTGTFNGSANDTFNFSVVGTGTIGTTPGLNMEVRNSANSLIATVNIGEGYTPGTPIPVGNGMFARLTAGTSNAGTFNVPVIADADTANVLTGLAVGGFFQGSNASNIAVNQEILSDPNKLATSRNGDAGETSNLLRMSNLRDARVLSGNSQTLNQFYGDTVGVIGASINNYQDMQLTQENLLSNLSAQEQSVVGVDLNEEMVNLLNYQRMVESGSRYISVVNQALDSIFNIFN